MRISILIFTILLLGCSKEPNDCGCEKITYRTETKTINHNGLPRLQTTKEEINRTEVSCQPEQSNVDNGGNTFFDIKCDG